MANQLVVYGDFNCPFSALASARVGELERRAVATFEWRAVEHDPTIPPDGEAVVDDLADMLSNEVATVRGLLRAGEPDRLRRPAHQVNTSLAIARYAGTSAEARSAVRQAIFAAHWEEGERIDDPAVLDRAGAGPADQATTDQWRQAWRAATEPMVPVLVLTDGTVIRGIDALDHLAALLESGAPQP